MTAWGTIDNAVEAMRRGARDYVEKPWDNTRLVSVLNTQVELGRALRRTQRLETENRLLRRDSLPNMIAESPKMKPVLSLMERVGPSDANVLITGEHGTGKELVAQWLHASSTRNARSFVAVNMGGLSEGVFESELFGHVKGSFTDAKTVDRVGRFELADGGNAVSRQRSERFLFRCNRSFYACCKRETSNVSVRRKRVTSTFRILSATNASLGAEMEAGRFREDLLFRLNTIEIQLPPLRERREDIAGLSTHFLRRHATRCIEKPSPVSTQPLCSRCWRIHGPATSASWIMQSERAVLLAQGDQVRVGDLGLRAATSSSGRLEDLPLEDVEKMLIQKALARHDGNVSRAGSGTWQRRAARCTGASPDMVFSPTARARAPDLPPRPACRSAGRRDLDGLAVARRV